MNPLGARTGHFQLFFAIIFKQMLWKNQHKIDAKLTLILKINNKDDHG